MKNFCITRVRLFSSSEH